MAYGILFGVGPSLVAETFGVNGLSQNWGFMTLAPGIFSEIFNTLYGKVYDSHSQERPDGHLECLEGITCYRTAYWATFAASFVSVVLTLWSVWHRRMTLSRVRSKEEEIDDDHVA